MVLYTVGRICRAEAAVLLLPALVSAIYREDGWRWFLLTAAITAAFGTLLTLAKPGERRIYAREGLVITSLSWIFVSLLGALPFYFSGEIPGYINCVFETVSGFTTTGSSVVTNPQGLSRGMAFWRSFTQWLGGMGVLVLVLAILPLSRDRSMHIMRAESPGPMVGKLVPRMADTAKILYAIYIALTVMEIILLVCGGMDVYDAVVNSFATAGTGGFSVKNASIAAYGSLYTEIVITVFMALFGVNFNLFFFLLVGKFSEVFKSSELKLYLGIMLGSMALMALNLTESYGSFFTALRYSSFQVSSMMTTTGFVTADFDLWPAFSKSILVMVMLVGACASSTGGGIKVQRVIIWIKKISVDLRQTFRPRSVSIVRVDGKNVPDSAISGVTNFLALYVFCMAAATLIISLDGYSLESNFTAVVTCLSNVGPGLGAVGPTQTFVGYSGLSKVALSLAMLLGRLELFPMLALVDVGAWLRRR